MLLPQSLAEPVREPSKNKSVHAVSLFANSYVAQELAVEESGNSMKCFIPVSLGDKLSVKYHIPCKEFEIIDLIIDGVLRNTSISQLHLDTHKGTFKRVCYSERRDSGSMGRIQSCEMIVDKRTKDHDTGVGLGNMTEISLAAVGTIEVRVYREIANVSDKGRGLLLEQADRGPIFENFASWWEINKVVDINGGDPSYQIGFTDPKNVYGPTRKNMNLSIPGFYLWASFKYVYRSISMLKAMGFAVDEDLPKPSIKPEEDRSLFSEGLTCSSTVAFHEATGREENYSEEEIQIPLVEEPNRGLSSLTHASIRSQPNSLACEEKSDVSRLASGGKETRYTYLQLDNEQFFGADFPMPVDDDYQSNSEGKEILFERSETEAGDDITNPRDVAGIPLTTFAAHYAQLKAEDAYAIKKSEVGVKVDKSHNFIAMPRSSHEASQHGKGVYEASSSSSQSGCYSQSFHTDADSKSTHVKPTRDNDQVHENGSKAHDPPSFVLNGYKDKDGAKVMDFSRTEALRDKENSVTRTDINAQAHITVDLPIKRKIEDISGVEATRTRADFMRAWHSMSDTERSFSRKTRREEHARKRQMKQQALDAAKAEATILRKQLDDMEASAIAKEEAEEKAELDEVDRLIELAIKESKTLKVKIEKLQDLEAQ